MPLGSTAPQGGVLTWLMVTPLPLDEGRGEVAGEAPDEGRHEQQRDSASTTASLGRRSWDGQRSRVDDRRCGRLGALADVVPVPGRGRPLG